VNGERRTANGQRLLARHSERSEAESRNLLRYALRAINALRAIKALRAINALRAVNGERLTANGAVES
jgi:plasmid stability protein